MRLKFNNIGKISEADIELNSITVIAGNNDTGKSTVGKLLYAVSMALHVITPAFLLKDKFDAILAEVESFSNRTSNVNYLSHFNDFRNEYKWVFTEEKSLKKNDLSLLDQFESDLNKLVHDLVTKIKGMVDNDKKQRELTCKNLLVHTERPANDIAIKLPALQDMILTEFSDYLTSEMTKGKVSKVVLEKESVIEMHFMNNELTSLNKPSFERLVSQSFYIDDPFILNFNRHTIPHESPKRYIRYSHEQQLIRELYRATFFNNKNYFSQALHEETVNNIFSTVIKGEIKLGFGDSDEGFKYYQDEITQPLSMDNVSTGIKSFSILQLLMKGGHLNDCEFLILDEPEIHLHPEWQLKYAELIVLLTIHYPIRVLLTSHSPYFVEAIELYSQLHEIDKGVRFYKTEPDGKMSKIIDVTNCIDKLYEDMAKPFRKLEELEDELRDE